jgi:hypothetical protein
MKRKLLLLSMGKHKKPRKAECKPLSGEELLKSCCKNGMITTNCYFKLYMGFEDSVKSSISKIPCRDTVSIKFGADRIRYSE